MDSNQFEQLIKRLDMIARLLTLNLPKEIDQNEKIEILADMDLQPKNIATILGITPNTVSIALHRLRRKKSSSGGETDV